MRTSIFMKYTDLKKEFREDIEFLWNLPDDRRKAVLPYITELYKTDTKGDWQLAVEKVLKEIGGNAAENLRLISLIMYIYREWNPMTDTPSNFVKDLEELNLIPEEKSEEARSFLLDFFEIVEKDNLRRLQKAYAQRLLPSFSSIGVMVDFRPIFKKAYGSTLDRNIENYNPECIDFVPIFLIKLERDSGYPTTFEFQIEEKHLDEIINQLKSAKKDLEVSKYALFERRDAT